MSLVCTFLVPASGETRRNPPKPAETRATLISHQRTLWKFRRRFRSKRVTMRDRRRDTAARTGYLPDAPATGWIW
jgi:hypothetical protein